MQMDVSFEKWYYSSMDFILEISVKLYCYITKKEAKIVIYWCLRC